MEIEEVMDSAVFEYISKNNGKLGSPDIVDHFGLRPDITLLALNRLEEARKIRKKGTYANHSVYELI